MLRRVACLLACLASAPVVRAGDLPEIQKRGTLRVATWDDNLAELFSYRSGVAAGLEGEILQGFASIHKLKIEVLPVPDPLPLLLKGDGDVIGGAFVPPRSAASWWTSARSSSPSATWS